ncbi:DUF2637 domain-containing protein [Parafrankia sp. EUN1f]|uniref:DUF2637 domain-containing protein n=1 Tax=Parafrankia sp. EUN1f TaxID=102897 RepID=UPI0001C4520A|nr:DUF2637 domain-containing protein [Parafrankia sp. EUN1f]EFC82853.1 hypothetical protein FrEUN1fDRAFT_4050 [Parafrankia sp. EUN1f]
MPLTDQPTQPPAGPGPDPLSGQSASQPRQRGSRADRPPDHPNGHPTPAGSAPTRPNLWRDGERWIRIATVLAVLAVAGIAAIVSYRHMRAVALANGEDHVSSSIIPLAVDGLIIAASMTMLADSRDGRKRSALAYGLLTLASAASLAANVMHAQPTLPARVIAAWPSAALIGAYELLMAQIRGAVGAIGPARARGPAMQGAPTGSALPESAPETPITGAAQPTPAAAPRAGNAPEGAGLHAQTDAPDPAPGSLPPPAAAASTDAGVDADASVIPIRPGSKKYQLRQLIARLPADDPRSVYALAKDLAPRIDLHEGTARRYIAQIRSSQGPQTA